MTDTPSKPKRTVSKAALAAAIQARKAKALIPVDKAAPAVFIVRNACGPSQYIWEIRRFGSVVLSRGGETYPAIDEAQAAGEVALEAWLAAGEKPPREADEA